MREAFARCQDELPLDGPLRREHRRKPDHVDVSWDLVQSLRERQTLDDEARIPVEGPITIQVFADCVDNGRSVAVLPDIRGDVRETERGRSLVAGCARGGNKWPPHQRHAQLVTAGLCRWTEVYEEF